MSLTAGDERPRGVPPARFEIPHWTAAGYVAGITAAPDDFALDRSVAPPAAPPSWRDLLEEIPGVMALTGGVQVHGRAIAVHAADHPHGASVVPETDGHLTNRSGLLLCVTVADCVPIYLRHDASGWMGLIHAGWRGTAGGVLEAAFDRLDALGVPRQEVVMHCGVSICGLCYEVGPEVHGALGLPQPAAPSPVDLRRVLVERAHAAGVEDVTASSHCTAESSRFHSHRGSGGAAGRMLAYLARSTA